jgi:putative sterol carrier protein
MATVEQCRAALDVISQRIAESDHVARAKVDRRSLACHLTDLDVTFVGQLDAAGLHDITQVEENSADVTMTMASDVLVALTDGSLSFPSAFATGKLKINASFMDLLKLRSFL